MDSDERNALVEQYLPACRSMAGKWRRHAERAGLNINGEDLYSEAYMTLVETIIPSFDPARGVPLKSWVNLQLRGRLSNYLHKQSLREGREIAMDINSLAGLPSDPEDREADGDLARLLLAAERDGIITEVQLSLLSMMGQGISLAVACKDHGIGHSWAKELVVKAKADIRREVLGIAD